MEASSEDSARTWLPASWKYRSTSRRRVAAMAVKRSYVASRSALPAVTELSQPVIPTATSPSSTNAACSLAPYDDIRSSEDRFYDFPVHIGQTEPASLKLVCQLRMIEA